MGGISISQIREAKLKSGMTEQQVDAEMNGLLIKISEQDSGINQNYKPEPTNTQHITRKTELVTHTDPLIEAQWKMRERLSETSRRDIPLPYEYWIEMRRKAMGGRDDG
jgi:hypothetical protein